MQFLTVRKRWDPLVLLRLEMQQRLSELMEAEVEAHEADARYAGLFPLMNLSESDDAFHLLVEVPGVPSESVSLEIDEEGLVLHVTRPPSDDLPEESFRRQERWHGETTRELTFPKRVDPAEVDAQHHAGVLVVRIAKAEQAKRRRVVIQTSARKQTP